MKVAVEGVSYEYGGGDQERPWGGVIDGWMDGWERLALRGHRRVITGLVGKQLEFFKG